MHAASPVGDRIEHAAIDATEIGVHNGFDVVAFKSVLGGLGGAGGYESQARAVRSMHAALRPGGVRLFAENLVASPLHAFLRRRFVAWGDGWRYVTGEEMGELLAPFSDVELHSVGFVGAFGRSDSQRSALAGGRHRRFGQGGAAGLALHLRRGHHEVAASHFLMMLVRVRTMRPKSLPNDRPSTYSRYRLAFSGPRWLIRFSLNPPGCWVG